MKRWLYLVHRWLGIALCVLMAAWFLSGVVMMYVGYPKLTNEERLAGLPPLQTSACCVPLAHAVQVAQAAARAASAARGPAARAAAPRQWRLTSVAGEPRYILAEGSRPLVAVDARSGEVIRAVSAADALASARHFAGGGFGPGLAEGVGVPNAPRGPRARTVSAATTSASSTRTPGPTRVRSTCTARCTSWPCTMPSRAGCT